MGRQDRVLNPTSAQPCLGVLVLLIGLELPRVSGGMAELPPGETEATQE